MYLKQNSHYRLMCSYNCQTMYKCCSILADLWKRLVPNLNFLMTLFTPLVCHRVCFDSLWRGVSGFMTFVKGESNYNVCIMFFFLQPKRSIVMTSMHFGWAIVPLLLSLIFARAFSSTFIRTVILCNVFNSVTCSTLLHLCSLSVSRISFFPLSASWADFSSKIESRPPLVTWSLEVPAER